MKLPFLLLVFSLLFAQCGEKKIAVDKKSIVFYAFDNFDDQIIKFLQNEIQLFYKCHADVILSGSLPQSAYKNSRNRYRADILLSFLKQKMPANTHHIIGITNRDISVTVNHSPDWGVFGYAYCPGTASVVSGYRLQKPKTDPEVFKNRLKNVVLHELGHNFGLKHCPDNQCLMKDAKGKLSSVEGINRTLCHNCQSNLNAD